MEIALIELGMIIGITVLISALMMFLKQPFIIGYIITGILVNYFSLIKSTESFAIFGQVGVVFLLFMVGLGLNPRIVSQTGKAALVTGIGQIILTSVIGFLISMALGYSVVA